MKHFFLFCIGIVLFSFSTSIKASCEDGVRETVSRIKKEAFSEVNEILKSSAPLSSFTPDLVFYSRKYLCSFDMVCEGMRHQYFHTTIEFTSLPSCKAFSLYEGKDVTNPFIENENLACNFSESSLGFDTSYAFCKNRIAQEKKDILFLFANAQKIYSKESSVNYYSAKLLSLTEKIRNFGDSLVQLKNTIQKTYRDITCSCP
jgi:hypothetical protein